MIIFRFSAVFLFAVAGCGDELAASGSDLGKIQRLPYDSMEPRIQAWASSRAGKSELAKQELLQAHFRKADDWERFDAYLWAKPFTTTAVLVEICGSHLTAGLARAAL